jgi:hypothetical protein
MDNTDFKPRRRQDHDVRHDHAAPCIGKGEPRTRCPGWTILGVMEAVIVIVILLAISLFRGAMIGNTALVLGQFAYLGVAVILTFVVWQLPPYRPVTSIAGEPPEDTEEA